jgi:hypothetical protein
MSVPYTVPNDVNVNMTVTYVPLRGQRVGAFGLTAAS